MVRRNSPKYTAEARRGRERAAKYDTALAAMVKICRLLPKSWVKQAFYTNRGGRTLVGRASRYCLIRVLAKDCGKLVDIRENVYIFGVDNLKLGTRISIHPLCYLDATGGLEIQNDVSIAHGVTILSTDHIFCNPLVPIRDQGVESVPTLICGDVWIGAGAKILGGVTINKGSIVGAGAVVTRNVEANTIVGGIPARVIGRRAPI